MARSEKAEDFPTTCAKCGGPLERRRRPLSLKELLAITSLIAFGGLSALSFYEHFRQAGLPGMVTVVVFFPHSLAALVLFSVLMDSPRHARLLRCARCMTPHEHPKVRELSLGFWAGCLAVFLIYLYFYVASGG